jgi:NAD(P)-dependent dehydrogenase (short-subunit alcohol dehydrogenase family)
MQRVLVTGAGIIGSHIARRLVEQGREVLLVDLAPAHQHIASIVDPASLHIVQADVTDAGALVTLAERYHIESVIHTAAMLTGPSLQQPARAVAVNIGGAINVMELARRGIVRELSLPARRPTNIRRLSFGIAEHPRRLSDQCGFPGTPLHLFGNQARNGIPRLELHGFVCR